MSEDIKLIVRKNFENVWNQGDFSVVDEIYATTYTAHIASISSGISSKEEFKQFVALFRALSPDFYFTIDEQISEGDMVATRWTARTLSAADTSSTVAEKELIVTGMSMHKVVAGWLVESWDNWDAMTAFQAMGQDVFESLSLHL